MASADAVANLVSVTAAGPGLAIDFLTAKANVSMTVAVTGTVTGGSVAVEASHDGSVWVLRSVTQPRTGVNVGLDNQGGAYRYWRSNVLSEIVGGGSVTTSFMEAG